MNMILTSHRPIRRLALVAALGFFLAAQPLTHAQGLIASDDATNYLDWDSGSNGGTGFGNWTLTAGGGGFFRWTSGEDGRPNTIDTDGLAFGIWNGEGDPTVASRGFAPGVWSDGSVLTFDFAFMWDGGSRGVSLNDNAGEIFLLDITASLTDGYTWTGGSAPQTDWTGERENGEVISFTFTQNGSNLDFAFSGLHGSSPDVTGTVAGTLESFNIFNAAGGGGTGNNVYFNNFEVIPEPSTYAAIFGALALLGAFVWRRRANRNK